MTKNITVPPKTGRLHHVTIEVNDIDDGLYFYTKILGFAEQTTPDNIKKNGIRWISLPAGQAIHLIESNESSPPKSAHLAIKVDDLENWEKYLNQQNIETYPPRFDIYNAKRFFFRDPSGNRIEFVKWLS